MKLSNSFVVAIVGLFLTACGGGGGSSQPSPQVGNLPPSVNISAPTEVNSGDIVTLTANATDPDGSVASYSWLKDSSVPISLSDATKSQVTFVAPEVDGDATLSISVTVSDNAGTSSKAVKQITVKNAKESFTISGSVSNGAAIPNADITLVAGDATFNAKTNTLGQYSIPVTLSKKNLQIPIAITATGDAKYPGTKLATQLNSGSKLIEQAGSDKVLDAKENPATNISNWTTAEYAFLTAPTYWGTDSSITTEADLQTALQSLGTSAKVTLATYLEIIATDSRFKLPAGYKNTIDFARDIALRDTFSYEVYSKDPTIVPAISARISKEHSFGGIDSGEYILYGDSVSINYLLKLDLDGTGQLSINGVVTPFKWVKQGSNVSMAFIKPVETDDANYDGKWVIKTAELNVVDQYQNFLRANLISYRKIVAADGKELYDDTKYDSVQVLDKSKFISPSSDKVVGEWASDAGIYQFNADKTATFKSYTDLSKVDQLSWDIDNKKLSLKINKDLTETFYFLKNIGVGYSYAKLSESQYQRYPLQTGLLIKAAPAFSLEKADLIGNWVDNRSSVSSFGFIRSMTSDGNVYTDITASPALWVFNDTKDGWNQSFYKQDSNEWATSCDVAQGASEDCRLFRTFKDKVIAVDGNNYYSLRTQKTYFDKDQPIVDNSLVLSRKLSEIKYFAPWIMSGVTKPFYQVGGNDPKVWNFFGNRVILSGKSLASVFYSGSEIVFTLKNNRLQYVRDNVARELELIKTSENGLTVCEFNQSSSCVAGTEFLLSNKSPAKINLKVVGAGSLTVDSRSINLMAADALYGNSVFFDVKPDSSSIIRSVTGCGGSLSGNLYKTSEVRSECTITATFGPIPVVTLKVGAHGSVEKIIENEYRITPDSGYFVDKATGCNGVLYDGINPAYSLPAPPKDDCTIVVDFKQKLSAENKIVDPVLAACVDSLNVADAKNIYELNCNGGVVASLEGIQNFPNINKLVVPFIGNSADLVVPEMLNLRYLELGAWGGSPDESATSNTKAIDISRAKQLDFLIIRGTQISSLDLSKSLNLSVLYIQNNPNLTSVDLSKNNKLEVLHLTNNQLSSIQLPVSGVLETLTANDNKLKAIDLSQSTSLKDLQLNNNLLTSIDLQPLVNLEVALLGYNNLTTLTVPNSIKLNQLQAKNNQISYVDVSKNINLLSLNLASNKISQISLIGLTKLKSLDLAINQISSIDLSTNTEMGQIRLQSNRLTYLDVSKAANFYELQAQENQLYGIKGVEVAKQGAKPGAEEGAYIDLRSNQFDADTLNYLHNLSFKNYFFFKY